MGHRRSALAALLHLGLEGYRWQMVPAYAVLILAPISLRGRSSTPGLGKKLASGLGFALATLLVAVAAVLSAGMPIPSSPHPDGPYAVGTRYHHLIDANRPEVATPSSEDSRSLLVQAWYPAEKEEGERAPLILESDRFMGSLIGNIGLPGFVAGHLGLARSHSYIDAPLRLEGGPLPVIIYSPGWNSHINDGTSKMEALASRGYAVFSIAHSYETGISKKPDGEWLTRDDPNAISINAPADTVALRLASNLRSTLDSLDAVSPGAQVPPMGLTDADRFVLDSLYQVAYPVPRGRLEVWADDQSFLLDELERLDAEGSGSLFEGRLDTDRVGSMGYSFGGPASLLAARQDDRIVASVNMDGSQFGLLYGPRSGVPTLVMHNNDGVDRPLRLQDWENIGSASPYYRLALRDAGHGHFADVYTDGFIVSRLLPAGPLSYARAGEISAAYVVAFFDAHVRGVESSLLEGETPYPEVVWARY